MSTFFTRNFQFSVLSPRRSWRVAAVCRDHVKANPACAWCGRTGGVQAHHIHPVWARPDLAESRDNLISLCGSRGCHKTVGHLGDFARSYATNVSEVCKAVRGVVRTITRGGRHAGDETIDS